MRAGSPLPEREGDESPQFIYMLLATRFLVGDASDGGLREGGVVHHGLGGY